MNRRSVRHIALYLSAAFFSFGCMELPTELADGQHEKRRALPLDVDSWSGVQAQDIAILLPRVVGEGIGADLVTRYGEKLMQPSWLAEVSAAFESTDVEDALERENWVEDWELVSMRIAPCSPLGKIPGRAAEEFCWPEVRLVWQPNQYDFWIGWATVEAHSDDRAIHALYRVYPDSNREMVDALIERLKGQSTRSKEDMELLRALRTKVLAQLLGDVVSLRGNQNSLIEYSELDLRVESMSGDEESAPFYKRLAGFLSDYATPEKLHTLTAFSLPEGRNPSGTDIWVFLAFDGERGKLKQRPIQVVSPRTGEVIFDYGTNETVTGATGDHRLRDAIENGHQHARELTKQIVVEPSDRAQLRERINNPSKTLVANTSCATCHSFNDLSFDFHNLSYLQEMEMTIAPRVRNDVTADLSWLRRR